MAKRRIWTPQDLDRIQRNFKEVLELMIRNSELPENRLKMLLVEKLEQFRRKRLN